MSVIQGLPRMKWRGLIAPEYDIASFNWDTGQAKRRYPGIDAAGHASVGRDSFPLTFRLYFLNSLHSKAFPEHWDEWWPKLRDGESGEMMHPVLGPIVVKAISGTVNVEARTTAGLIVDVRFEEHLEDPAVAVALETVQVTLRDLAESAQAAVEEKEIEWPSEAPVTDLLDAIDMIDGALYSANLTMSGYVNRVLGTVGDLIDTTKALQDHEAYPAVDALTQLYVGLYDLAQEAGVEAARSTAFATAVHTTTLDAIARAHGNTMAEIMTINESLIGSPVVDAGTEYRYYV
jgi:hypothetical protein